MTPADWESHLLGHFKTLLIISTDPGRPTCMWITPSAQVNVSVPVWMVGLLLPNHVSLPQEYTVFHQFPADCLLESGVDNPSHCNRQQQAATKQGVGGTRSRIVHFQWSIVKNKLGKNKLFLNKYIKTNTQGKTVFKNVTGSTIKNPWKQNDLRCFDAFGETKRSPRFRLSSHCSDYRIIFSLFSKCFSQLLDLNENQAIACCYSWFPTWR